MTKTLTLAAQKRNPSRQGNRNLQEARRVLGVVYGHGKDSMAVSVDASDILRAYRKAGNSSLINLDIDGEKTTVLLKDVNLHPVRHEIDHVDFFAVNLKEKTTVSVDLVFIGESEAVKSLGGVFVTNHITLDIRCLPSDSPRNFEIDKEALKEIGDTITIKDLGLDAEKYEVVGLEEDETLCSVIVKRIVEEVEEETAEVEEGEEGAETEGAEEKTGDKPEE